MTNGKKDYLVVGIFGSLNRINKLSKYAKTDVHDFTNEELSEQEKEMSFSSFNSKLEQVEILISELRKNANEINQNL